MPASASRSATPIPLSAPGASGSRSKHRHTAGRHGAGPSCGASEPAVSSSAGGCCSGKGLRRCLAVVGLLYFQISTFALVQYVKEHADLHVMDETPWPRIRRTTQSLIEQASTTPQLLPPSSPPSPPPSPPQPSQQATTQSTPPPLAHAADAIAAVGTATATATAAAAATPVSAASTASTSAAAAAAAAPHLDEDEEEAVDERPNELPNLDRSDAELAGGLHDELGGLLPDDGGAGGAGAGAGGAGGAGGLGPDAAAAAAGGGADAGASKVKDWRESDAYGKFIGISTFFNPGRHQNKVDNFRMFRRSVALQGLQMLCVELIFGDDAPYQLAAEDCDILVQKRTAAGNTLWQKERLLNIAVENLPKTVEKVMWLDSDLIFLNDDWVPETAALLDRFPVVQPFGWMTYLPQDEGEEYGEMQLPNLPLGQGVGGVYHSAGLAVASFPDMCFRGGSFLLGHPGFAWAARRDVIEASRFYDRSIIGGGDRIMLNAFTGHGANSFGKKVSPAMAEDVRGWAKQLTARVGAANMSYTPGVVLHIWHGDRANRDYTHRYEILKGNLYDPAHDVRVNAQGVLEWSSDKPRLHQGVSEYFDHRKEGPKDANRTRSGSSDDMWASSRPGLTRAMRSFLGYHCSRAEYRPVCKLVFKLWSDALRLTQLQLHQKRLRKLQAEAAAERDAAVAAHRKHKLKKKAHKGGTALELDGA